MSCCTLLIKYVLYSAICIGFKEKGSLLRTFSQLLSVEANATKRRMMLKPRVTSHCVYRYQLVYNTKIALLSHCTVS